MPESARRRRQTVDAEYSTATLTALGAAAFAAAVVLFYAALYLCVWIAS